MPSVIEHEEASHVEYHSQVAGASSGFVRMDSAMCRYARGEASEEALLRIYQELVESHAMEAFVGRILELMSRAPEFTPLWISSNECPIIANSSAVLSIRCHSSHGELESIYAAPGEIVLTLLTKGPRSVELFESDEPLGVQRFVRRAALMQGESLTINRGQAFRINGEPEPALYARLLLGMSDHTATYDASTLEFIAMVSLDPIASRWDFMAQVAGYLDSESAKPILARLVRHPSYNVRWKALQSLFGHDTELALGLLSSFRTDPSEYIATQAREEYGRICDEMGAEPEAERNG
ncbi:HEAT repeat domain-containing protein [Lysobacter sp. TAF61]|uniref:HEAT repeat domain-containing protein n=1 Tax=Lysobacter sp. TAF61 TaxID=3233072 RepID=UPI003F9A1A66